MLFFLVLAALWSAGGASRADVVGQIIVRAVAAVALLIAALWGPRPSRNWVGPLFWLLAASTGLAVAHVLPLPPSLWQVLPGRNDLMPPVIDENLTWRPFALVPSAALNALFSLILPITVFVLLKSFDIRDHERLLAALLISIMLSMLLGLFQFSGMIFDNPLINETRGTVSGSFANRNHFALFLAIGCILVPGWVFAKGGQPRRRGLAGAGLILIFILTILSTGSRAGIVLGTVAIALGLTLSWRSIRLELQRYPRWVLPAFFAGIAVVIVGFVALSIVADRAVSIDRAFDSDAAPDMRVRGLPIVLNILADHFPWGVGLGGFEPSFRIRETLDVLKPTYFNHAHNDFIEIAVDAGLPGVMLLAAAVLWWAWSSVRVWWAHSDDDATLPRLGSAILLLILLASVVDYPARTPMIMAVTMIAGVWLSGGPMSRNRSALPGRDRSL